MADQPDPRPSELDDRRPDATQRPEERSDAEQAIDDAALSDPTEAPVEVGEHPPTDEDDVPPTEGGQASGDPVQPPA